RADGAEEQNGSGAEHRDRVEHAGGALRRAGAGLRELRAGQSPDGPALHHARSRRHRRLSRRRRADRAGRGIELDGRRAAARGLYDPWSGVLLPPGWRSDDRAPGGRDDRGNCPKALIGKAKGKRQKSESGMALLKPAATRHSAFCLQSLFEASTSGERPLVVRLAVSSRQTAASSVEARSSSCLSRESRLVRRSFRSGVSSSLPRRVWRSSSISLVCSTSSSTFRAFSRSDRMSTAWASSWPSTSA